ncbi:MAG: hypothetical protein ACI4HI_06455 [Lachnospiraceae bacterium]
MKRTKKMMLPVLAAGLLLAGCGKAKPEGTYTYENSGVEISFTFDGDTVSTNLDGNEAKCSYKIDQDGKIEFVEEVSTSEQEEIDCSYNAKEDVVMFQGAEFKKKDEKK